MLIKLLKFLYSYHDMAIVGGALLLLLLINLVLILVKKRMLYPGKFKFLNYTWIAWLVLLISVIVIIFSLTPKVIFPNDPSLGVSVVGQENPILVKFDRPIRKNKISYEISPPLKGSWRVDQNYFTGKANLTFNPSESPDIETRYTISLGNIKNSLGKNTKYLFSFQTPGKPNIISVAPGDGDAGVLASQDIILTLDNYFEGKTIYDFEVSPSVPLEIRREGNKLFATPQSPWAKGTQYALKIWLTVQGNTAVSDSPDDLAGRQVAWEGKFRVVEATGIKSYSPTGTGIYPNAAIKVEFKQDMDRTSVERAFQISPKADGDFSWEGNRTISFKPRANLEKNTQYSVTISQNAKIASGEGLEGGVSYNFTTLGYVVASAFTPTSNAKNISVSTPIKIAFSQPVDHASAEKRFTITPNVSGSFAWSGNTMTFSHGNFAYGQKYDIKVGSGVGAVYGLDSNKEYASSFETGSQAVTLSVPSYHQAHMYSCMASAARSALAFKGVNVSEDTVISRIGYDRTPWSGTWNEPGSTWGDPNVGIVGDVDGKANNIGWGYGAYWNPVANAIRGLGKTAEVKTGWDVSGIASELASGNPVVVWWVNGVWPAYEVTWYKNGTKIRGVNSMHVQVVKGFTGTVENPQTFTVTDSGYGYPSKTFDVGTFKAKWSWFGNAAIVVK